MTSVHFVLLFDGLLLAMGGLMAYDGRTVPALSIFGAVGLVLIWQIALASITKSFARAYRWESFFRPTHYVQAVLHTSLYAYLGIYWEGVLRYAPLIVTQIIFGYLCDMLITWSRGRVWRIGLGVVPIVLSTNLFLWFRESAYYLQLALMLITFLGKEFVTWEYAGRRRHIVNPSAFSLSLVSVLLLVTNTVNLTHAVDIAVAFDAPPNFYEVIFLLGLVVQSLFIVTPVSCGAALALYVMYLGSKAILGESISVVPISPPVFLGITFLVTDPATSPRSYFGRFLFGIVYGVGVTITYVLLRFIHEPAVFDKLLVVPVANLCVPLIDRLTRWIEAGFGNAVVQAPSPPATAGFARFGWLAAYIVLIGTMLPTLKANKTKPDALLPPPVGEISADVECINRGMIFCRSEFPDAFRPFGFRAEIANSAAIRSIYQTGSDSSLDPLDRTPPASR